MGLLDDTIAGGQAGHITDHQQIAGKLNRAFYDVRADFGATGDGSTDDRAAIQAAYDALPASASSTTAVGGILFFPPGVYKIGSPGLDFATDLKPAWLLGAQGSSVNTSPNRAAVRLITSTGNYNLMQIGPETGSAKWWGMRVSNMVIRDVGGANTGAGIWLGNSNDCLFENVSFQNWQAGTCFLMKAQGAQPQYTTLVRCLFDDFLFGLYQDANSGGTGTDFYASDTELYGCIFHAATSGTAVPAGSICIKSYRTLRMFGGAVQDGEVLWQINDNNNKVMGTAFETTKTGTTVGIDIVAGNGCQIVDADITGTYSVAKIRVQSGVSRTQIIGFDDQSSGVTGISDSGTRTIVISSNYGIRTRAETTANLTGALAVAVKAGAEMYNTTTSKPCWSDGTVFRYADGVAV